MRKFAGIAAFPPAKASCVADRRRAGAAQRAKMPHKANGVFLAVAIGVWFEPLERVADSADGLYPFA
jgi:hypothetical protein